MSDFFEFIGLMVCAAIMVLGVAVVAAGITGEVVITRSVIKGDAILLKNKIYRCQIMQEAQR